MGPLIAVENAVYLSVTTLVGHKVAGGLTMVLLLDRSKTKGEVDLVWHRVD